MARTRQTAFLTDDSLRDYLGSGLLTVLTRTPLKIGSDLYTIRQLARDIGVTNAKAAGILSKVADDIGAKNTQDFYDRSSPSALARIDGVGTFTVYVALRLFESRGLDGHAWFGRRTEGEMVTTFNTIKRKEQQALARTKKGARRRSTGNAAPVTAKRSTR